MVGTVAQAMRIGYAQHMDHDFIVYCFLGPQPPIAIIWLKTASSGVIDILIVHKYVTWERQYIYLLGIDVSFNTNMSLSCYQLDNVTCK